VPERLEDYRKSIDLLDAALVHILAERMRLVVKVGIFKSENNMEPLRPERWQEVLSTKKALGATLGLPESLIEEIYTAIHEHALKIENDQR
jgi:chorismate mutase